MSGGTQTCFQLPNSCTQLPCPAVESATEVNKGHTWGSLLRLWAATGEYRTGPSGFCKFHLGQLQASTWPPLPLQSVSCTSSGQ